MFLNLKKTLFLVGSSALLFSACGDDGGGGAVDAAVVFDADTTDAMPDTTFNGTVSIAELVVSNDEVAGITGGVSGAAVVVSFTSPVNEIAPHPDFDNNIGECEIKIIDADAEQGSDGGDVTITGTNAGDFTCSYNGAQDTYLCSSNDNDASGAMPMAGTTFDVNLNGPLAGTVTLTIPGADFSNIAYAGMSIVLDGFIDPLANEGFAITGDPNTAGLGLNNDQLLLANGTGVNAVTADTTLAADSGYLTLVGKSPVPGGYDFLDDAGVIPAIITKADATDAPAIDSSLTPNGHGFTLADDSVTPHEIPASGDVKFSCDDAQNGACGIANGTLQGIVVFGETTDTTLTAADSFNGMPDPTTQFARFQCSGIGMKSITMPSAALALIMGTSPTRIQTTVTYTNGELDGANTYVVANGLVGFTTAPFAAP